MFCCVFVSGFSVFSEWTWLVQVHSDELVSKDEQSSQVGGWNLQIARVQCLDSNGAEVGQKVDRC